MHQADRISRIATSCPPAFSLRAPVPAEMGKGPFIVAIVDPDAPTPENPTNGPVRHFLGGDSVLKDDGVTLKNNTPAITEYVQPNPADGSQPHRSVGFSPPSFCVLTFRTLDASFCCSSSLMDSRTKKRLRTILPVLSSMSVGSLRSTVRPARL